MEFIGHFRRLTPVQRNTFVACFLGWALDAFDFFILVFCVSALAAQFQAKVSAITEAIFLTLAMRPVGAFLFGLMADRFGRRPTLMIDIIAYSVFELGSAFAPSFKVFLIMRAFFGIAMGGEWGVGAALTFETLPAEGRGFFSGFLQEGYAAGYLMASLVYRTLFTTVGWRGMFVIGALPAFLAMVLQRLIPESPRWLATRGRNAEAQAALARIERATEQSIGGPLPPPLKVSVTGPLTASWSDLFGPTYLRRTLVVWVIWFAAYFFTYGLVVWLPTIYSTVFKLPLQQSLQYGLITQAVGLFGALCCALSIDYIGRRPLFTLAFAASAIALGALFVLGPDSPQRVLALVSAGFFFVSVLSLGVYVYTPELYPTRARAMAVGTATAWLRFASILGPGIVGFIVGSGLGAVFLMFAAVAVVGAIVTGVFAVETKRRVLEHISP